MPYNRYFNHVRNVAAVKESKQTEYNDKADDVELQSPPLIKSKLHDIEGEILIK